MTPQEFALICSKTEEIHAQRSVSRLHQKYGEEGTQVLDEGYVRGRNEALTSLDPRFDRKTRNVENFSSIDACRAIKKGGKPTFSLLTLGIGLCETAIDYVDYAHVDRLPHNQTVIGGEIFMESALQRNS